LFLNTFKPEGSRFQNTNLFKKMAEVVELHKLKVTDYYKEMFYFLLIISI